MINETFNMDIGARGPKDTNWKVFLHGHTTASTQMAASVSSYAEAKERADRHHHTLRFARAAYNQMVAAGVAPMDAPEDLIFLD